MNEAITMRAMAMDETTYLRRELNTGKFPPRVQPLGRRPAAPTTGPGP